MKSKRFVSGWVSLLPLLALIWLGETQAATMSRGVGQSGGSASYGGGGYASGGERGSVIQAVADPEVLSELALSSEQQERIRDISARIRAHEHDLHASFVRSMEEQAQSRQERSDELMKKYQEARQKLAEANTKILEQLTAPQKTRLQTFCRQAAANEPAFQARMGDAFSGGGSRSGGGGGGGGGGGAVSRPVGVAGLRVFNQVDASIMPAAAVQEELSGSLRCRGSRTSWA